ncbi:MAG: fumarylacetoacetate hydrolase family protein [Bacillota bacterium]|nr:fumarylacetoacetate hydrolase family protein [Bacillota bacterium]
MAMTEELVKKIAAQLLETEDQVGQMDLLTLQYPEITNEDAYKIQLAGIEKRTARGEKIVGKKIGLLNRKMQEEMSIKEPDYGIFTDLHMMYEQHDALKISECNKPRMEAEIAFVLKEDLAGPGVTVTDVLATTAGIIPAIEIVDTRFNSFNLKIQDTIADRASNGKVILGSKLTKLDNIDLKLIGMACYRNGELVYTAAGAEVMGSPAQAVAWLANKLAEFGQHLKKGEIIMAGALGPLFDVKAGDVVEAHFDKLGSVILKVVE